MPFCPNCGIELKDSINFCPKCGCELKGYFVQPNYDTQFKNEVFSQENNIIQNKSDTKNQLPYNYSPSFNQTHTNEKYKRNYFLILLFLGVITCLFVGFISLFSINSTNTNVVALSLALLGLSAILIIPIWFISLIAIYLDAKNIGAGKNPVNKSDSVGGPGGWFIGALFLWILFFPVYLYQRKGIWENNLGYN